jgi:hypothetical protein
MEPTRFQKSGIISPLTQKKNTEPKQNDTTEATQVPNSDNALALDINTMQAIDKGFNRSPAYDFSIPYKSLNESDQKIRQNMPSGEFLVASLPASKSLERDRSSGEFLMGLSSYQAEG